MRRPAATPTIAEGFHREEAAGRAASSLFAIIYYWFLGASGLANRITETTLLWEDPKTPIAYGKISGQSKFRGIRGGQPRSTRS